MKSLKWIEIKKNESYRGYLNGEAVCLLYECAGSWQLEGICSNRDNTKESLMTYAEEKINEYGLGGSFSMGGGGQTIYPSGRFGQPNKGGFNASLYGGTNNSMYTYDIVPLNRSLQQKASELNDSEDEVPIYPGETIQGKELNKRSKTWVVGVLTKIERSEANTINAYVVQDIKTQELKRLDPTTVSVFTKLHNSQKRNVLATEYFDETEPAKTTNESLIVNEELERYIEDDDMLR